MQSERRVRALLVGRLCEPDIDLEALRGTADDHGSRIEPLAAGSGAFRIIQPAVGSPTDQAIKSTLLALALRREHPRVALSIATGLAGDGEITPLGGVVDHAVLTLLEAQAGEIWLDKPTTSLVEGLFELAVTGERCLLIRRLDDSTTRTLLGKPSPWVGRRRELDNLLATFDECVDSSVARAVLVTAAPGMGKSRLASEVLRALAARGDDVEILRGQAEAHGAGSPFVMIGPAIRRSAGIRDGESLDERRHKLRARLRRSVPEAALDHVTGFLGELVGVPFPDDHDSALRTSRSDPMLLGAQMRTAFRDWLAAECASRPMLIVLEDLHWGDQPSVSFLDAALRDLHDRPIMVLALARPEVHAVFPALWQGRLLDEVRLHALPPKACAMIVRDALGDDIPEADVASMVARSEGNPFYLEEVVRAVADGAVEQLPASVLGMVQARLLAVDPEARRVLRAASVFGEVFWLGGVQHVFGGADSAFGIEEWLGELVRLEIVHPQVESRLPGQREYRFRHALLREAAHEMLVEDDRASGHRAAGEWLVASGESDAVTLASHFQCGEDPERAVHWLVRAAEQALEASDLASALEYAEHAVAAGATGIALGELRGVQAVATFWLARYRDSARHGEEAIGLLDEGSTGWFRAIASAMVARARLGDHAQFDRLFERAEHAPGRGAAQLRCLCRGAFVLVFKGSLARAEPIVRRIEALVANGDPDPLAVAQLFEIRSVHASSIGEFRQGYEEAIRAIEAYERAGDPNNACMAQISAAYNLLLLGDFEGGESLARASLAEGTRLGAAQAVILAKFGLATRMVLAGINDDDVLATFTNVLALVRGHPRMEGWTLGVLAELELRIGHPARSAEHAALAIERLDQMAGLQPWAMACHARALLGLASVREALELARQAIASRKRTGVCIWGDELLALALAEALEAAGDPVAARNTIRDAREHLLRRAASLDGTRWRESFLALPDRARILALAAAWDAPR
ncbi:MAG: AAA family ATPase [Myxococcota bacterium]|nr:AAA family ATPase [Myxococcota bacterium]